MKIAKTIKSVRTAVKAARKADRTIGLVPTMGALHRGHVSLIERSAKHGDFVVVSIFVNPTQFGPKEDLAKYPRPLREDLRICEDSGVDVVFVPSAKEMYPEEEFTWVSVDKISEPLCGRFRPGHFQRSRDRLRKAFQYRAARPRIFWPKGRPAACCDKANGGGP